MAFANLFTRLSAVEEGVKSPGQPAFTHRNENEDGKRGKARKRKAQAEQTGSYNKKQHYQAQTIRSSNATPFKDEDSKTEHCHRHNTSGEHASFGFAKEMMYNQSDKVGYNNMCHKGQNYKTRQNNVKKQQQNKKPKGQKNQHQQKDQWRPANRGSGHQHRPAWRKGGGDGKHKNDKQNVRVKRTRMMTQEFKDQNAVMVDGRLVCRHFLWGRCIKDDECQLEHIQGYNDLVKEVCKFYVQGFCSKGESCPYMHKSFPCKFFHRKGKCSQGEDCRFSHEQLNDVTNQLLNEALKRDSDLAKRAEQETSGEPEKTDESEIIEANGSPGTLHQPLRPNFYNSTETNTEKETSCQTDVMEEAVPQHASDASQHHTPLTSTLNHEEPVCYSVAAVLGLQLSKPFPHFFTTPGSQESGPLSSSDCSSGSANQSTVPYSVDAVLRSCKSVENATFCHTATLPTTQSVSYTPKSDFKEITDPLLRPETQNEKVLHLVNTRNEVNKSEKISQLISSPQVQTSRVQKICPSSLVSRDCKKQHGSMPASLKSAQRAADGIKLELCHSPVTVAKKLASSKSTRDIKGRMHLPTDMTCSVNCKTEAVLPFGPTNDKSIFSRPTRQTNTSEHPMHAGSMKTTDSANSISRHFAAEQPTEIHLHSRKTQSGLKRGTHQYSAEITAEGSSKMERCGDLQVGCKKSLKRPFHSLFAGPITDTLQPVDDSVSSSCPRGFIQSSCPASQSVNCSTVKSVVEPVKASASSFLSLFAAPLSAASLPCVQFQPDDSRTSPFSQQPNQSADTTHLSDSKQSLSNLKTHLPCQGRTDIKEMPHVPGSPNFSPNSKSAEDSSMEPINPPTQQLMNPVCSLASSTLSEMSTSLSSTHADQQLPNISSHKGSTVGTTANSVLKTLFQSLSPYQQDEEQQESFQISVPSDSRFPTQRSSEKTVERPTEQQPAFQSRGISEPEVTNSGTQNLPCKPAAPLMQHHTRHGQKHSPEEGKCGNGSVVATPLKDLFKTLEPTVFHFGH